MNLHDKTVFKKRDKLGSHQASLQLMFDVKPESSHITEHTPPVAECGKSRLGAQQWHLLFTAQTQISVLNTEGRLLLNVFVPDEQVITQ